jgi:trans-2,3-dihydro-3-hydroxyanthranilate isomerase
VLDADDLDAPTMQAIALEMNLSETAFVRRSSVADFGARYFTPAEEIPMAGHPTIATTWALVEEGRLPLRGERTTISLELPVGPIRVDVEAAGGRVTGIVMTQKKPVFLRVYDPSEVLPVFGLEPGDVLPDVPVQTVSTGTPQLMVPLRGPSALRRAVVDARAYAALRAAGDFFSPHLFCLGGFTPSGQTSARHFGMPPNTPADPFTGSATGGMAAYLWRYGLLAERAFVAEQGHWMKRPGSARVEVLGPREDVEAVRVGGQAVTVFRGELALG